MSERMASARRGTVRLVVPSPDGRRLLARPNGLAGWALPAIAVDLPFDAWDASTVDAASAVVGTAVEPGDALADGAWIVRAERVAAAGNAWIGAEEVERLGTDAAIARAWFRRRDDPEG